VPHFDPFAQANYVDWTFSTVQMWGEAAPGTWTLRLIDEAPRDAGAFQNATLTLTGSDLPPPPVVTSAAELLAVRGEPFNHQVTGTNGPLTIAASDPLPPNLELDPQTGILAGIPIERGTFNITFNVANTVGETNHQIVLRVVTPYEKWCADYELPPDAGPDDDADADLIPNLVEYARGSHPLEPDSPSVTEVMRKPDGGVQFSFRRAASRRDVACVVEVSPDLETWSAIARSVDGEVVATDTPRYEVNELSAVNGLTDVRIIDSGESESALWFRVRYVLESQ
jgi:hypothetical protein